MRGMNLVEMKWETATLKHRLCPHDARPYSAFHISTTIHDIGIPDDFMVGPLAVACGPQVCSDKTAS